ncbi:MAG: gamma-glutamyltransferase family protein [Hyphomicrobiaceae bacterium]|nr:gamma-glutamyltransferase family protein [Hyphomicrobiaceae bacterium]
MLETARCTRGMVVAPHHLAAEAGLAMLRDGGNAIEAMVAAAATIAVVYPHMNGLGGDNFWLVSEGGKPPVGIDACGAAAGLATREHYAALGHTAAIPSRGPLAALTVAGAVSGWQAALELSAKWGGRLPLERLLADAVHYARAGFPASATQVKNNIGKRAELEHVPGFASQFMPGGQHPEVGDLFKLPLLAATFEHLHRAGLDDFYRGDLARQMAAELEASGSPLRLADLERHRALMVAPLAVRLTHGTAFGMPPPTQGLASMMILGLFDRLGVQAAEGFDYVHGLVEATKQAFLVRDRHVTDPAHMSVDPAAYLTPSALDERARQIDPATALAWPQPVSQGDTVWLGAIDAEGRAVSFIQSVYWEFGSGLVLPGSGVVWQNRGTSFALDPGKQNALLPYRRPFHTIQPAMALLDDGRVMPYGTMGGEGQPQTQAAIYTRHVMYGQDLQAAINAPRWLLGRTWGSVATNLRVESRLGEDVIGRLRAAGHDVEVIGAFDEVMGHAGALVLHRSSPRAGTIEGAADPRSDGRAAGF